MQVHSRFLTLLSGSMAGATAQMQVAYSGTCTADTWSACWDGTFGGASSNEVTIYLTFDNNSDPCDDTATEVAPIDYTDIQAAASGNSIVTTTDNLQGDTVQISFAF